MWEGKGASPDEMAAAKYVTSLLGGTATEVNETKEPGQCQKQSLGYYKMLVHNIFWEKLWLSLCC